MKKIILIIFYFLLFSGTSFSEIIKNIKITGNERVSSETIIMFSEVNINDDLSQKNLNTVLKNLYSTNFFQKIDISINNQILIINVIENPVVQTLKIEGIKKKKILEVLNDNIKLKEKTSFQKNIVKKDENTILNILKSNGFYFAKINTEIKENTNNTIDLIYNIELGDRAYIKKIKFIGDKKIKNRKLKSVIVSEEDKFWKFISRRKFLDVNRIKLDENLLRNYYKNNGYFNAKIESSSAQIIDEKYFELIFNIDAGEKYYFNNISFEIPDDFDPNDFKEINNLLSELKFQKYSLNSIKKILKEIDKIALSKSYEFIDIKYNEKVFDNNKIDLKITAKESDKFYVKKINVYGNNITDESVIRNKMLVDEGDALNQILLNKSINQIKSTKIFKKVDKKILDLDNNNKIIEITVEEMPTGEIFAGAGTGTSGSNISAGLKENNFLGRGIKALTNVTVTDKSITGDLSFINPNFKNSDRSLTTNFRSTTTDQMSSYGYKTDKTGFSFGTKYEQFEDIYFSPTISSQYESLKTSSIASAEKKKQAGDYFDFTFSYGLALNKLNQNFQPSDGFKSVFRQSLPIYSEEYSIKNTYEFATYEQFNETIFSFIFFASSINALSDNEDVRISKRIVIPSRKLRGFERGRIGPLDNGDFIGGNYGSALNLAATLPKLFPEAQDLDFNLFFDAANVWGVDYNSSLDKSKLRSSAGLAIDWFTPIGPLSFSFAQPLSKADSDKTETFRFNIGTSF